MEEMPKGMIRRGGAYSLRRRVPLTLIATYGGRKEIVRALGTNDFAEAKLRHARMWVALDDEFEGHRQSRSSGPELAIQRKLRQIAQARASRPPKPLPSNEEVEHAREQAELASQFIREGEREYEAREFVRREILELLDAPDQFLDTRQKALKDIITDAKWSERLAQIKVEAAQNPSVGQSSLTDQSTPSPAIAGSTPFITLVERWQRVRNPLPRTVRDHLSVTTWFTERTGVAVLEHVSADNLASFIEKLSDEGVTPDNIKTKLSRLKTLLAFALKNKMIPVNPAADIERPKTKKGKRRIPWDRASLNVLFDGPVHRAGDRPQKGFGPAAYWLPLLALYTGARREELGQLRGRDIKQQSYTTADGAEASAWMLDISYGEDGENNLKNAGSERTVPIHKDLIDLGLVAYASSVPPGERLFSALRPDKDGKLTGKWGEWFSNYRRETCGLTDSRLVFHSFRHSFKDYCREVTMPDGIQRQLMGHRSLDVADEYGLGFSTHQLVEAMRRYRVPGIKLPSPFSSS